MRINSKVVKMLAMTLIMIMCLSVTAFGESRQISVCVNDEKIDFEVNPVMVNGRVMVPLRGVFEKLGAKVDWNKNTLQVVIKDQNNEITMMLGKNKVIVNGEIKDIDCPVEMVNSRTFAPLRFISEMLGHDVKWDNSTNTAYITKNYPAPAVKNTFPLVGTKENLMALLEYNSKLSNYLGIRNISADTKTTESAAGGGMMQNDASAGKSDSSATNNQVEGVDEGDIIKNDGKYIFVKSYGEVKIIDSNPSNPKIVSNVVVPENMDISDIYLSGNKLVVIGQNNYYYLTNKLESSMDKSIIAPRYYENRCNLLIYNIEAKDKPVLEREYLFDGNYTSGRTIDNNLYLVTTKYFNVGYDTNSLDIPLPYYTDCKTNEKVEIGYDKIRYFPNYVDSQYVLTVGINLEDKASKPDVDAYLGGTESIFVSSDSLYASVTDYSYDSAAQSDELYNPVYDVNTVIYKFGLNAGNVNPAGQTEVSGSIINQFSMDEHNDMLRIATTTGEVWQTGENESKNNIYILDKNLKITGKLEGLAPGERIYSTRFMGDKVYMVTFKQVDPLFVIDTSDAAKPQVLGYLKIPGYSTYLHPVDETHIIGFGYDTEENRWGGTSTAGLKISLFDVSDFNKPKELSSEVIGKSGTYSELIDNHKALMFSLDKGIMAFPVARTKEDYATDFVGAYVYNVKADKIDLKAKITHIENLSSNYTSGNEIKRIIYIGDYLYTFSDNLMQVHSISSMQKTGEISLKK